jgi:hypothetical protein
LRRNFATDRLESGQVHEGKVARLIDVWVSHTAPLGSAVGPHPRYCRKCLAACDAVRGDGHSVRFAMGKGLKGRRSVERDDETSRDLVYYNT